jgi:hypothetical protein
LVKACSPFGHRSTLLHYVAANGVEIQRQRSPSNAKLIAQILLAAGAEPDALNSSYGGSRNATTLCLTVSSYHPYAAGVQSEIAGALIDAGACVNGLNDDSMPLATALAFGYVSTAIDLAERGAHVDNIVLAAGLGRTERIREMIDAHGTFRSEQAYSDPFGETITDAQRLKDRAFLLACKSGFAETARALLDLGADVNCTLQWGQTALHWAAYDGNAEVVDMLLSRGVDVHQADLQWNSVPAVWAKEGGHLELARRLHSR